MPVSPIARNKAVLRCRQDLCLNFGVILAMMTPDPNTVICRAVSKRAFSSVGSCCESRAYHSPIQIPRSWLAVEGVVDAGVEGSHYEKTDADHIHHKEEIIHAH